MKPRKKLLCNKCRREISISNYRKHTINCRIDPEKKKAENFLIDGKYICPHCLEEFNKQGILSHIWRAHSEKGRNHNPNRRFSLRGDLIWNKNRNKSSDKRLFLMGEKISESLKKNYRCGKMKRTGWASWTDEQKKKWSEKQSTQNQGGRCKWYEVDGKKVQGKWEKNIAEKMLQLNIPWLRCKSIIYKKEGKEKRYTPDFYLPDHNIFLEIKGYWWNKDREKMNLIFEQHPYLKKMIAIIENKNYKKLLQIDREKFDGALADMVYASA